MGSFPNSKRFVHRFSAALGFGPVVRTLGAIFHEFQYLNVVGVITAIGFYAVDGVAAWAMAAQFDVVGSVAKFVELRAGDRPRHSALFGPLLEHIKNVGAWMSFFKLSGFAFPAIPEKAFIDNQFASGTDISSGFECFFVATPVGRALFRFVSRLRGFSGFLFPAVSIRHITKNKHEM